MTTFSKGQVVTFDKNSWFKPNYKDLTNYRNLKGESYTIVKIEASPVDQIKYNSITHDGGIGHHQLITIVVDGVERTFSGLYFDPEIKYGSN